MKANPSQILRRYLGKGSNTALSWLVLSSYILSYFNVLGLKCAFQLIVSPPALPISICRKRSKTFKLVQKRAFQLVEVCHPPSSLISTWDTIINFSSLLPPSTFFRNYPRQTMDLSCVMEKAMVRRSFCRFHFYELLSWQEENLLCLPQWKPTPFIILQGLMVIWKASRSTTLLN